MSLQSDLDEMFDFALTNGERLYAPIEIAFMLQLEQATIQELCRKGKLAARKFNNQWMVPKAEIQRYLKEGPRKIEE